MLTLAQPPLASSMKSPFLLAGLLTFSCAIASFAEDRITNGNFSGGATGSAPPAPWDIKSKKLDPTATVTLASLPGSKDGKLWASLSDLSKDSYAKLGQNFPPVDNGKLSFKFYIVKKESDDPSFNIYLSGGREHVVDLKVSKGTLRVDANDKKIQTKYKFSPDTVYSLSCEFQPAADPTKLEVKIGLDGSGGTETVFSGQVNRAPIDGFRIITDVENNSTVVYVADLSLVAKE